MVWQRYCMLFPAVIVWSSRTTTIPRWLPVPWPSVSEDRSGRRLPSCWPGHPSVRIWHVCFGWTTRWWPWWSVVERQVPLPGSLKPRLPELYSRWKCWCLIWRWPHWYRWCSRLLPRMWLHSSSWGMVSCFLIRSRINSWWPISLTTLYWESLPGCCPCILFGWISG